MSTHNLCFRAKIRKIGTVYPCVPQFCYIKVGYKGVYITRTCFPDDCLFVLNGNSAVTYILGTDMFLFTNWAYNDIGLC